MSYCDKCGKYIEDKSKGCTYCNRGNVRNEYEDATLSNGAKVAIVAITLLIPGLGYIIGLVLSLVYMGRSESDYRSFGKALLTLCLIVIGFTILCCIIGMFSNFAFLNILDELEYMDYYVQSGF